jgi:hypothetical protein
LRWNCVQGNVCQSSVGVETALLAGEEVVVFTSRKLVTVADEELSMTNPNQLIAEIGRRMASRWATNAAGGNISMRVGDQIHISPRFADLKWGWQLQPEQIV